MAVLTTRTDPARTVNDTIVEGDKTFRLQELAAGTGADVWVLERSSSGSIAPEDLTLFPLHADTTDPATVASSENVLETSGVRAITFTPTAVAQKSVHEILETGTYQLEITKFATTPITIQVDRGGGNTFAKDLSLTGVLTDNAVDTSELSLAWEARNNDVSWIISLGALEAGDKLNLWGNDIGDPSDFNGYEYALTKSGSISATPEVTLTVTSPTANADVVAKVGVSQDVTLALSPNTYLQSVTLDGVPQSVTQPTAGVFWLENPTALSSTIVAVEDAITTGKAQVSIGEYYFNPNKVDGVNLDAAATYETGIDFTRCKTAQMALASDTTENRQQVATSSISWASTNTAHMQFNFEAATSDRYVDASFASEADARAGRIRFNSNTTLYAIWIEGFSTEEAPFTIPVAYTAAAERSLTLVGGTGFINGVDTGVTPAIVHEGFQSPITFGLTPGYQLESATSAEFGALNINVLAGTAQYTPGPNNDTITITEKLSAIGETWLFVGSYEFNPGNDQGTDINTPATHTHGIPMKEGDEWRILYSTTNGLTQRYYSSWAPFTLGSNASQMRSRYQNGDTSYYIDGRCDDAAMAALGQIILNSSTTCYAQFFEVRTRRNIALAVPTAYQGANPRDITLTGGTGLINGLSTETVNERVPAFLKIGLNPNKQLATITSTEGYSLEPIIHRTGTATAPFALVLYLPGANDDVLTITEEDAPTHVANLLYFSCTPKIINANMPDTGGTNGTIRWTPSATHYTVFDPDGIINADDLTLDLPQGRYEAILNCRGGSTKLVEMGVFLGGVELNHVDAPYQSGSGAPKTISSTTQPLIFDVPVGGGAVTVQKQAASDTTVTNFAFTLKQLPTATEVVTNATVIATAVTMTANATPGVVEGIVIENVWSEIKVPLDPGNFITGTPELRIGATPVGSVVRGNAYAGMLKVLIPLGTSPAVVDVVYTQGPYPTSTIEYLFATARSAHTTAANNHSRFDTIEGRQLGSNIILDTTSGYTTANAADSIGRILIKGGTGLYRFKGRPTSSGSGSLCFGFYDVEAGVYVGSMGSYEHNSNLGAHGPGEAIALVEPAVDTRYELRFRVSGGFTNSRAGTYGFSHTEVKKIIENQGV